MRFILVALMSISILAACGKEPTQPVQVKERLVEPIYQRFLTACSGVTITDGTSQAIAYGTCVGYTRGFADGHQVTVAGIQRVGLEVDVQRVRLWCIPPATTNVTVMEVVVSWIAQHPTEFEKLMSQFDGINAATAVIVRALGTSVDFSAEGCK